MPRRVRTFLIYSFCASVILLLGIWVVLESSLMKGPRISLVEGLLEQELGYEVQIEGDVGAALYPTVILYVKSAVLPGSGDPETTLAILKDAELHLSPRDLLRGEVEIDAIFVDDLQVNLLRDEDGSPNWEKTGDLSATQPNPQPDNPPTNDADADDLAIFLLNRTIAFSNIHLNLQNEKSGFEFIFLLRNLTIDHSNSGRVADVASSGSVNGQEFLLEAHFVRSGSFSSHAIFGETVLSYDGQIHSENYDTYVGDLEIEVQELGGLLETLGLNRSMEGHASVRGSLSSDAGFSSLSNLDTQVELNNGRTVRVTGSIGDLSVLGDLDIKIDAKLAGPDAPMQPAQGVKDIRLNSVSADIHSVGQNISVDEIQIGTNIGHKDFRNIGPITVDQLVRTPDGKLGLLGATLSLGNPSNPFLKTRGEIRDLLNLSDYDANGEVVLPAPWVFSFLPNSVGPEFGAARAVFEISDSSGTPTLKHFTVSTEGTDLWAINARSSIGNLGTLGDAIMEFDLEVPDGAAFLKGLDLDPVAVSGLKMSGKLERSAQKIELNYSLGVEDTEIVTQLVATRKGGKPNVRGSIVSHEIKTADLKSAIAAALQITTLADRAVSDDKSLILPAVENPDDKPLVLPETAEQAVPDDQAMPLEKPLVIEAPDETIELEEFFDFDNLAQGIDLEISIDVEKLVGQSGLTHVRSDLKVQDGKMRFGPIEASMGGGYFNFGATMDVVNAPNYLRLTGAASGWDFGKILRSAGAKIPASGTLQAQFDVAGQRSSVDAFLDTMSGVATVSMTNAKIGTSLLELAGLGVFPWLFSKERNQGYSDIVCIRAPLHIKKGRVASDATVIETPKVQVVINGFVDFHKDAINLLAKPRPLGQPLARAAWPFSISGPLSKPVVKITSDKTGKPKAPLNISTALFLARCQQKHKLAKLF